MGVYFLSFFKKTLQVPHNELGISRFWTSKKFNFEALSVFSKKGPQLTLENCQKSGFYVVKFPKLLSLELAWVPQFFDQKNYQKLMDMFFLSISRLLLFFEFLQINYLNFDVCYTTINILHFFNKNSVFRTSGGKQDQSISFRS